jgi:hypothetical protein
MYTDMGASLPRCGGRFACVQDGPGCYMGSWHVASFFAEAVSLHTGPCKGNTKLLTATLADSDTNGALCRSPQTCHPAASAQQAAVELGCIHLTASRNKAELCASLQHCSRPGVPDGFAPGICPECSLCHRLSRAEVGLPSPQQSWVK